MRRLPLLLPMVPKSLQTELATAGEAPTRIPSAGSMDPPACIFKCALGNPLTEN